MPRVGAAYIFVPVFAKYLRMRNFSVFSILFPLLLEEIDDTARVQHVLRTTGCSWGEVVLDNILLCRLIRVFY